MTKTQKAAMQQALDILDSEFSSVQGDICRWCDGRLLSKRHNCKLEQTIDALRAALAEPEPEAVAISASRLFTLAHLWAQQCYLKGLGKPCDIDNARAAFEQELKSYTTPPARRPLTDAEIDAVTRDRWGTQLLGVMVQAHREYARAIERAHGITGGNDE